MQPEALQEILQEKLSDCEVRVEGDGYHYQVVAVGERFAGLSPVKKQQAVYSCIHDLIADGTVHAVSIKTYTPDEWAAANK
ncbi:MULTISPECIES: BolA family protein [unclassified Hahella]|uniref:BolA family protein n=1 Tax=unclassified Hahella TaxID=2624107 RepID=UPI000FDD7D32|nr:MULTISPECIES: BolA family protein [unclassified Hahella]AZZ90866.1 BolA family transcriptional regulator [Hahella sp. KA22]MBU6949984.1 BolA family transcriptional regulator [Hahella sp. HN01]MDG9668223.1 BolA family transcriptional regulator [Hahella sp. CR1]QAY54236.1 BolA/IbaG family iron-sulfur metabolism protein [Hahella sp. KA22]